MRTNLPCFTPRRSYVTLNRRTKLQWYLMWDWFYANDSLSCFPDVCPITANMEEGALRPGIPSAAPVMASGTPELPVTPVCINRPVILVTPFSHSYAMCFKFPSQHLACSTAQQVVDFFFFFFCIQGHLHNIMQLALILWSLSVHCHVPMFLSESHLHLDCPVIRLCSWLCPGVHTIISLSVYTILCLCPIAKSCHFYVH